MDDDAERQATGDLRVPALMTSPVCPPAGSSAVEEMMDLVVVSI